MNEWHDARQKARREKMLKQDKQHKRKALHQKEQDTTRLFTNSTKTPSSPRALGEGLLHV